MATQPEAAVGSEAPVPAAEPINPFEEIAAETYPEDQEQPEQPAEATEEEATQAEPEEPQAEDEPQIEEEELPPIDAPVSWDGEAKEAFKQLPRELQETVQKREAEREKFVQAKSQEAANAQRNAQIEALRAAEQIKAEAVQHLQRYAQQFEVKPPSAELMNPQSPHYNPVAYAQQLEVVQNITAQREQAQRDAEKFAAEQAQFQTVRQQHEAELFHQQLSTELPEIFDPTTGQELLKTLTATAQSLGFDPSQISDVTAIKALKVTSEWKAKADKYDAAMKKQMERVRSGKNPPPIAKPGTVKLPAETQTARAEAAWQQAITAKTRVQRDQAIAAWAETSGLFDT